MSHVQCTYYYIFKCELMEWEWDMIIERKYKIDIVKEENSLIMTRSQNMMEIVTDKLIKIKSSGKNLWFISFFYECIFS